MNGSYDQVIGGNGYAPPIINAEALLRLLGSDHVSIIDVRGAWSPEPRACRDDFDQGHIPGAIFLDWTKDFLEQGKPPGIASVSTVDEAANSFKRCGINGDCLVVVYDDYHHMFAGRIWWAMRYFGFANVSVLNGGWSHWKSQSLPVSKDSAEVLPGNYTPALSPQLRLDLDSFIRTKDSICALDGRGENSFLGEPDNPKSGHIPGTINMPFSLFLDERTGLFKEPDVITAILDLAVANWRTRDIVVSCGSGYSATVPMIALLTVGKFSTLFDESFAVWKQDETRPINKRSNQS